MPWLGDALVDARCTDDEILAHCRNGQPHYRGCWLLDLIWERGVMADTLKEVGRGLEYVRTVR